MEGGKTGLVSINEVTQQAAWRQLYNTDASATNDKKI